MKSLSDRIEQMTIAFFDYHHSKTGGDLITITVKGKDRKKTEAKVRKLIRNGNYGAAVRIADPDDFNRKMADLSGGSLI